jgi:RimJ/RimL family protein N-acetyltransferase
LPSKLIYKVIDSENGTAIGHIELAAIDRRNGSARVCRVLVGDPAYRGRGVGTVVMEKIVCRLGLQRIELSVFGFNTSAIRCYERVGFVKEEHLRECRKADDGYWSFYIMAISRHEWESSRDELGAERA